MLHSVSSATAVESTVLGLEAPKTGQLLTLVLWAVAVLNLNPELTEALIASVGVEGQEEAASAVCCFSLAIGTIAAVLSGD